VPEATMWGLVVSLLLLAIGTTLKAAEASHSLKLANEEIARLRKQLEAIQEETKNLPLSTGNLDAVLKDDVTEVHDNTNKKETLTFTSADSVKIAPGIQVKTTIKQNGWYCVSDDLICAEHQRTLKPDNYSRPYEYTCRAAGCKIKLQTPLANLAISEAKDLAESHIRNTLNVEPRKTNRIYG